MASSSSRDCIRSSTGNGGITSLINVIVAASPYQEGFQGPIVPWSAPVRLPPRATSQPINPARDFREQRLRHGDLGEPEGDVAASSYVGFAEIVSLFGPAEVR